MNYEARFTWVDGGRLRDRATTYGSLIPLGQLRALIGSWEQVLLAAADAASWRYEKVQIRGECIEITFPDGSRLVRPEQTVLHVGASKCTARGMATICETRVTLVVPPKARNAHARCLQTRSQYPAAPRTVPSAPLAEPSSRADVVRRALRDLRITLGSWSNVASALKWSREDLEATAEGRALPSSELATRIARYGRMRMESLLEGKRLDHKIVLGNWAHMQNRRAEFVASMPTKAQIQSALEEHGGNLQAAAASLGTKPEKLRGYGLDVSMPPAHKLRELLVAYDGNVAAVARELSKDQKQVRRWLRYVDIDPDEYRR